MKLFLKLLFVILFLLISFTAFAKDIHLPAKQDLTLHSVNNYNNLYNSNKNIINSWKQLPTR